MADIISLDARRLKRTLRSILGFNPQRLRNTLSMEVPNVNSRKAALIFISRELCRARACGNGGGLHGEHHHMMAALATAEAMFPPHPGECA
jgi:hypothetical protein